jgi:hypothetical protein
MEKRGKKFHMGLIVIIIIIIIILIHYHKGLSAVGFESAYRFIGLAILSYPAFCVLRVYFDCAKPSRRISN